MEWLLYGANGYTGELVARRAVARGLRPILGGRSEEGVGRLAAALGRQARIFELHDVISLRRQLAGVGAVLNCAGPFSRTARPLADACIAVGVHYLDVTGEIAVFEGLAARSGDARAARVMLLPGVGFDVVPTDCLAAHLAGRLPTATQLTLALQGLRHISRGTASTMIENAGSGGMVRRAGRLTRVPSGWRTRAIDFGAGPKTAITIPWGDVATAFYSTGIPDIEVYVQVPTGVRWGLRAMRVFEPLAALPVVKRVLLARVRARPRGPDEAQLAAGSSVVWGQVADRAGRTATARLSMPDGYALTAESATAAVERVLSEDVRPGFQTPSLAYGPEFVLGLPGVSGEDLD